MEFIIKIDTRKKSGKKLLEYLKTLSFVKIQEKEADEDKALFEAMETAKTGKYIDKNKFLQELKK